MERPLSMGTLPAEMQTTIATHLEHSDLAAFRLTARNMCAAAHDVFLDTHFTNITFISSIHGLTRLSELLKQKQLLEKLQRITLLSIEPPRLFGYGVSNAMDHIWDEESDLVLEYGVDLLAGGLRHLKEQTRDICFTFACADVDSVQRAKGHLQMQARLAALGIKYDNGGLPPLRGSGEILQVLLNASAQAGLPIRSLDICGGPETGFVRECRLVEHGGSPVHHGPFQPLRNLSKLHLTLTSHFDDIHPHALSTFLTQSDSLVHLSLNVVEEPALDTDHSNESGRQLKQVISAMRPSVLRSLALSGLHGSVTQFATMLARHRTTLEQVNFSKCVIPYEDCWRTVLEVILKDLELRSVHLTCLARDDVLLSIPPIDSAIELKAQLRAILDAPLCYGDEEGLNEEDSGNGDGGDGD